MSDKTKKIFKISARVLSWLLIVFLIFTIAFMIFTVATVDKHDRTVFGYKFYIVQSDSMSESELNKDMDVHFNAGDIVIVDELTDKEKTQLKAGDIISFISTNDDSVGETITHMIKSVEYDERGNFLGYKTFGTNKGKIDKATVEPSFVLGKYSARLPMLGHFFAFVKTTTGYITCILIPFLLLILYNGANIVRLLLGSSREKRAARDAEHRAEVDSERRKNEEMKRELEELRARLNDKERHK